MSLLRYVPEIAGLVNEFRSKKLLAYLCGPGLEYRRERVHVVWGVEMPILYAPDIPPYNVKPAGQFDGVICCDALDDLSSDALSLAVSEIAGYARQWAFISAVPAVAKSINWSSSARLVLREMKLWA